MTTNIDEIIPQLRVPEIAAMVVLMAQARQVSNPDLTKLTGSGLDKPNRERLNNWTLIESVEIKRSYWHELTERGWHACRMLHEFPRPGRSGSAGGALYALLAGVDRALGQRRISTPEFFGTDEPGPDTKTAMPTAVNVEPTEVERLIRAAYRELAPTPGDWVGLADLRDRLAAVPRTEVDAALRRLAREPEVHLAPETNLKSLTQRDRDAALWFGLDYSHHLSIEGR